MTAFKKKRILNKINKLSEENKLYPKPIFEIFGQGIYLYGICMAIGIIACFIFVMTIMDKRNFNEEAVDKILLIGIAATAIGVGMAAVVQALYDYIANPDAGFKFGGMTFYGGLIGGVGSYLIFWNLYVYVIAPRTKIKLLQNNMNAGILDAVPFIPIGICIAHAFGRLGCFFAGCCYGGETDAWYGITFYNYYPSSDSLVPFSSPRIPTQLFECIFLALLALIMAILYFRHKFECNMGIYCIGYGVFRFLIEYLRADYRGEFVVGLTPSQFWAIVMMALGIGYFFVYKYFFKKLMKRPELQPSVHVKNEASDKA